MEKKKHDEIEIELVMEAYEVKRARALAILEEKDAARAASARRQDGEGRDGGSPTCRTGRAVRSDGEFEMLSAKDFFGDL